MAAAEDRTNEDDKRPRSTAFTRLGEGLRQATASRRRDLGMTLRAFLAEAVEGELPGLVEDLRARLPSCRTGRRGRPRHTAADPGPARPTAPRASRGTRSVRRPPNCSPPA